MSDDFADLTVRAQNVLAAVSVRSWRQLAAVAETTARGWRNCGPSVMAQLTKGLHARGLDWILRAPAPQVGGARPGAGRKPWVESRLVPLPCRITPEARAVVEGLPSAERSAWVSAAIVRAEERVRERVARLDALFADGDRDIADE